MISFQWLDEHKENIQSAGAKEMFSKGEFKVWSLPAGNEQMAELLFLP